MVFEFFKKKKPKPEVLAPFHPGAEQVAPASLPSEVPVDHVLSMQSQGLTNNQIIQTLQRQGYSPQQIYDAMAQAEAKKGLENMVPEQPSEPVSPSAVPSSPVPPESHPSQMPESVPSSSEARSDFEELAEQIVEEKWKDIQKEVSKMSEWRSEVSSRMDKIEQSIADLKSNFDGLHKAIISRISEYDKTLIDVGTEIKAMEKVFQKVLPELTSNVQELSRITKASKAAVEKKPLAKAKKKSKLESKI
ncbi:hypothetical protein DRJ22_00220 [Candidatus Woesearchaeota archaeon]|nr:MAG: hypothetical protein DRJ22_00220 [Candidatus Woesearchaeota archaeon]